MQDIVQLIVLNIMFVGNEAASSSSNLIDSAIFLGLPIILVVALEGDMELLETETNIMKGGTQSSIGNFSGV